MTSSIPKEIVTYILSFLGPYDLASVAPVSKLWNDAQKTDLLWKRHCLDYLDHAQPHQGSWKERLKIIYNWLNAEAEKTCSDFCNERDHDFTILEDNTPLSEYFVDSYYAIHNLSTGAITPIDQAKCPNDQIISSVIHEETWVALTNQGKILFFDLLTGQYLKEINPPEPLPNQIIAKAIIKCSGQEVITAYNNEIRIWDANTRKLKGDAINISHLGILWALNSTLNFIICTAFNGASLNTVSIRKSDQNILSIKELFNQSTSCADSSSYFATIIYGNSEYTRDREIYIFEDTKENLNSIRIIVAFDPKYSNYFLNSYPNIYIYKNWLLASKDGTLHIFNIKTGEKLSTIQHNEKKISCCSNASHLFMRISEFDPLDREDYHYSLYNFERPITKLNLPKTECTIQ